MDWVVKYWLECLFGAMVSLLGIAYQKLARRVKEQDAVKMGIQALLRDRLLQAYNHYVEKGYCPVYARDNIDNMYRQYTALGGNGNISDLIFRLFQLPTEADGKQK